MLRIHLVSQEDAEPLTMLLPAHPDQRLDFDGPEPWLFKGRWDGKTFYGEVRAENGVVTLDWSDGDHMTIDLDGERPVTVGRVFLVTSDEGRFRYVVRDAEAV